MTADQVTIIIPALNEAEAVGTVVEEMRGAFPAAEVIVIDDGSTDGTGRVAEDAGAHVIRHESTLGYGASLRTGVDTATRPYVLFVDGDGQHSASDARQLMEASDTADMVVGARDEESHIPLLRRPGKFFLTSFGNFLAGERLPDFNSGLRIIRKEVLQKYMHLMPMGFSFSTTTTFAMLKGRRRVLWVPITVRRRVGTSSVRQVRHGSEVMLLMLRLTVLFEPLRVFLWASAGLAVLTAGSSLIDVLLGESGLADTTVLLAVSTLLVFLFGLICDQVSALRRELHE